MFTKHKFTKQPRRSVTFVLLLWIRFGACSPTFDQYQVQLPASVFPCLDHLQLYFFTSNGTGHSCPNATYRSPSNRLVVRLYSQSRRPSPRNLLQTSYMIEQRVFSNATQTSFACHLFDEQHVFYCFRLVCMRFPSCQILQQTPLLCIPTLPASLSRGPLSTAQSIQNSSFADNALGAFGSSLTKINQKKVEKKATVNKMLCKSGHLFSFNDNNNTLSTFQLKVSTTSRSFVLPACALKFNVSTDLRVSVRLRLITLHEKTAIPNDLMVKDGNMQLSGQLLLTNNHHQMTHNTLYFYALSQRQHTVQVEAIFRNQDTKNELSSNQFELDKIFLFMIAFLFVCVVAIFATWLLDINITANGKLNSFKSISTRTQLLQTAARCQHDTDLDAFDWTANKQNQIRTKQFLYEKNNRNVASSSTKESKMSLSLSENSLELDYYDYLAPFIPSMPTVSSLLFQLDQHATN